MSGFSRTRLSRFRTCCCRLLGLAQPDAPARARRLAARPAVRRRRHRCRAARCSAGAYWLTTQLAAYEEFGDYLLRLGLSWLFLSFLAFLAFSGIVTALSTFFLSDDLRLLMTSPIAARRLFAARFTRTLGSASWMVVIFMTPVLAGIGVGRCAPLGVLSHRRGDGRAVCHDSRRARVRRARCSSSTCFRRAAPATC